MKKIKAVRGFNDILPEQSLKWEYIHSIFNKVLKEYGYEQIILPILERKELFHRSVGQSSDIVSKETYDFEDRNGDELTLRPEGTAGCVRAVLENNLISRGQTQKLWYLGPMFRYERPQKGRYRQFYQLGIESYGFEGLAIELEQISLMSRIFKELGINKSIELEINSLGSVENRQAYSKALTEYLHEFKDSLDSDSITRLDKNPLRILDSKDENTQKILENAPKLIDYIDKEYIDDLDLIIKYLKIHNISYEFNHRLVRGLDYYSGFVFEWKTDLLGSQSAVCAGGRYDGLITNLGGENSGAIGMAIGFERLQLLIDELDCLSKPDNSKNIFAVVEKGVFIDAYVLIDTLRIGLKDSNISIDMDLKQGSIKSQFKKANKSSAKYALIIGEKEINDSTIIIKDLYSKDYDSQVEIKLEDLTDYILNLNF